MEKFDRRDLRLVLICLVVIAAGAAITLALFRRAFPEASIQFRVNREEARAIAERMLTERGRGIATIEATPVSRPNRTDWVFVDERGGFRMGEATVRYRTTVSGGAVAAFQEFVHVPEAWTRAYEKLRSKNNTANLAGNFAL